MSTMTLERIRAGYGQREILKGVSLTARSGEVLALIGPNGAGKTTLIRTMCRVLKPFSGRALLDGKGIWAMKTRCFAQTVARVSQNERLSWPFTVYQVVTMGRFAHRGWLSVYTKEDHDVVDGAIRAAGLWDLRGRAIDTLSGGEAQRVMVARALAQRPKVLVLDEPVAHLDIKHRIDVLDTVRSLASSGMAIVVSLHDLNLAALYADRIALLSDGRVRILDSPEHVLTKENLEGVYGTRMVIGKYPGNGRLTITPIPAWLAAKTRSSDL